MSTQDSPKDARKRPATPAEPGLRPGPFPLKGARALGCAPLGGGLRGDPEPGRTAKGPAPNLVRDGLILSSGVPSRAFPVKLMGDAGSADATGSRSAVRGTIGALQAPEWYPVLGYVQQPEPSALFATRDSTRAGLDRRRAARRNARQAPLAGPACPADTPRRRPWAAATAPVWPGPRPPRGLQRA